MSAPKLLSLLGSISSHFRSYQTKRSPPWLSLQVRESVRRVQANIECISADTKAAASQEADLSGLATRLLQLQEQVAVAAASQTQTSHLQHKQQGTLAEQVTAVTDRLEGLESAMRTLQELLEMQQQQQRGQSTNGAIQDLPAQLVALQQAHDQVQAEQLLHAEAVQQIPVLQAAMQQASDQVTALLQQQHELVQQAQGRALALGSEQEDAIATIKAQLQQLLHGHQHGGIGEQQGREQVAGEEGEAAMDALSNSLDDINQRLFELRVELQNADEELSARVRVLEGQKEDVEILEESRKAAAQRAELAASEALEKVNAQGCAWLSTCTQSSDYLGPQFRHKRQGMALWTGSSN